ncbi:MAG: alpha/beta fold hydrolase [Rhodothermales bacterium]
MKFEVDRDLFPFENHFLKTDSGEEIHYVDEGQGVVVLMLHGNPTWSFLYRKMILRMREHFRCIAPDYPGFGLSTAPKGYDFLPGTHTEVLARLIENLGLTDFILVVQDWGGPIGLALAERFPERVRGMVIGNTWAWPLKGRLRIEGFSWLMGGPIGRWMARSFNGVWRVFMKEGFVNRPSDWEMAMYEAPFRDRANRIQTAIFPRQLVKAYEFEAEVEAGLEALAEKPVLFLWGTNDFAFQEPELERFKALFPNHLYHPLEASHFWQDDQGEVASDYIIDWARQSDWL